jgi:ATPase subunit of ABC transporter with duplicated ATPase domains
VEVAKVKKRAVLTGVRNVRASKDSGKRSSTGSDRKAVRKADGGPAAARRAVRKTAAKAAKNRKATAKAAKHGKTTAKAVENTRARSTSKVKSISKARARARVQAPVVRVVVKPLEPQAKCGAGTSVQSLFRVDETVDGRTTTHLVFFDRHGWYCEHGRNCPAVGHAKKHQGRIARAS